MTNLLFVCSRNQMRSPTGETVWQHRAGFSARSAGTSPHARRPIGPADIRWADVIFVMEPKHLQRLQAGYARLLAYKQLHCLDIADDYRYMDPQLVALIDAKVTPLLRTGNQADCLTCFTNPQLPSLAPKRPQSPVKRV